MFKNNVASLTSFDFADGIARDFIQFRDQPWTFVAGKLSNGVGQAGRRRADDDGSNDLAPIAGG